MKKNMNRVTGICLGVIDMKKSLQFYRDKLGFKTDETGDNPDVVFFCTPGTKLELYPLDLLAKDIDPGNPPAPGSGFGGDNTGLQYHHERGSCGNLKGLVWPASSPRW